LDKIQNNDTMIALPESVKVGISPLKDAFNYDDILAYPDVENEVFYFDKENIDLIKNNYTIIDEKENEWILKLPFGFGKFRIEPMEKLDFGKTKVRYHIPYMHKDAICYTWKKGACINFDRREEDGTVKPQSYHVPVEHKGCKYDFSSSSCYAMVVKLTWDIYDGYDCQGPTQKRSVDLVWCAPPA